jgi:predicted GNAT family acetyltransferase
MSDISYNEDTGRYEQLFEGGAAVYARTHFNEGVLYIDFVEAAPQLRGSGAAGVFMKGLMEHVRGKSWKVEPICGYAASWIRRHSEEYEDLRT